MSGGGKESLIHDIMDEQLASIREGRWNNTIKFLRATADDNVKASDKNDFLAMISIDKLKLTLAQNTGNNNAKELLLMLLELDYNNFSKAMKPKRFETKHKRRPQREVLLHKALEHNAPVDIIAKIIEVEGEGVLLEKGSGGKNALQTALKERSSLDVILKLIEIGGSRVVLAKDDEGWNSFHFACKFKVPVGMKLIEIGGKELVLTKDVHGQNSWQIACQHNASTKILMELIEVGGRDLIIKNASKRRWSPLHYACRSNVSIEVVIKLIEIGGKKLVLEKIVYGGSINSFHLACKNELPNEEILSKLIEIGGKELIMQKDSRGENSLHYACFYKVSDLIILKLIEIGGRDLVLDKTSRGVNALHVVSEKKGSIAVVSKLIEVGGKNLVLEKASHGQNPLQIACQNDASIDVVMKLINIGGRELVLATDSWDYNSLHYISSLRLNTHNRAETNKIVLKLIEIGGKNLLIHRNNKDLSPLHSLISERMLIQSGVNKVESMVILIHQGIDYKIGGEFGIGGLFHFVSEKTKKSIYNKWHDIVSPALEQIVERGGNEQLILHAAIINKAPLQIIKNIIENIGCVGIQDSIGRYPIDVAIEYKYAWNGGMKEIAKATASGQGVSVMSACAKHGLPWERGMRNVLENSDIGDIERRDISTSLYPFMLAAASGYSYDLAATFQLIMLCPGVVKLQCLEERKREQ